MNLKFFGAIAGASLLAGAAHANLVTNGGFDTGDFTGWTQGGNTGFTFVAPSGQGGSPDSAYLGPIGSDGTLDQTFTDRAGYLYKASFYLKSDGRTPNDFFAQVDGLSGSWTDIPSTNGKWVKYFGYFIGNGTDTFSFAFRNDPGYLQLDSVAVNGAVPEPAAWALMTLGFGAVGFGLRSRRKAVSAAA